MKLLFVLFLSIFVITSPALAEEEELFDPNFSPIILKTKKNKPTTTTFNELQTEENTDAPDDNINLVDFDLYGEVTKDVMNLPGTDKKEIFDAPLINGKEIEREIEAIEDSSKLRFVDIEIDGFGLMPSEEPFLKRSWKFVKGKPINNSMLLGMFSHHTSETSYNNTQNLIGVDFRGYSVGTFKNSYSTQTYYAGISRKIYEREFKGFKFDAKYKLIAMHGYGDHYPDLLGITPLIMPMFGISRGFAGMDFLVIPAEHPIFSVNFRVNLPEDI